MPVKNEDPPPALVQANRGRIGAEKEDFQNNRGRQEIAIGLNLVHAVVAESQLDLTGNSDGLDIRPSLLHGKPYENHSEHR